MTEHIDTLYEKLNELPSDFDDMVDPHMTAEEIFALMDMYDKPFNKAPKKWAAEVDGETFDEELLGVVKIVSEKVDDLSSIKKDVLVDPALFPAKNK